MAAQSRPLGPYKEAIVAFFGLQRVILVLGRKIVVGVSDDVAHLLMIKKKNAGTREKSKLN
jgi:hypothetical protein